MAEISSPAAWSERMAASRPAPGPFTQTSTFFSPSESASFVADSAAICAAKGVLLREPLKPTLPALAQATVWPSMSAMVTIVLLNVDWTWAIPLIPTFRSRFFLGFAVAGVCCWSATRALLLGTLRCRAPPRRLYAGPARRDQPAGFGAGFLATAVTLRMAPAVFFGPLRVRAFVRVRCPRAGRFFR
jgi:hypothetical protein